MRGNVSGCVSKRPPARKSRLQKGREAVIYTHALKRRTKKKVKTAPEEDERGGEQISKQISEPMLLNKYFY